MMRELLAILLLFFASTSLLVLVFIFLQYRNSLIADAKQQQFATNSDSVSQRNPKHFAKSSEGQHGPQHKIDNSLLSESVSGNVLYYEDHEYPIPDIVFSQDAEALRKQGDEVKRILKVDG